MIYTREQFERREQALVDLGAEHVAPSLAQRFARLPRPVRAKFLEGLAPIDAWRLLHAWKFWGRPKQLGPLPEELERCGGEWSIWLNCAGRGTGKNRVASEWCKERVLHNHGSGAFIGADWTDVKRYMVGGSKGVGGSSFLDVWPFKSPDVRSAEYFATDEEIRIPAFDTTIYLHSAEKPEWRGAGVGWIWADEIIKWRYLGKLLDNIEMTLREQPGDEPPQMLITTTPMPIPELCDLLMDPDVVVTHAHQDENEQNLPARYMARQRRKYDGTRIGEQERGARILGDNPDALFHQARLDQHRVTVAPELLDVGVGVDPAVSEKRKSDDTGIVGAGVDARRDFYALADETGRYSAEEWPRKAVDLAIRIGANFFAVERNKIGDLAAHVIRVELQRRGLAGKFEIREAYSMHDKAARATPAASYAEQGRLHVVGRLARLETEITQWNPKTGKSPNGLDALVHVGYELCGWAEGEPEPDASEQMKGFAAAQEGFDYGRHGKRRGI